MFFAGTTPIGNLFTGGIASVWGPSLAVIADATIAALAVLFCLSKRQAAILPPAEDADDGEAPPESLSASQVKLTAAD